MYEFSHSALNTTKMKNIYQTYIFPISYLKNSCLVFFLLNNFVLDEGLIILLGTKCILINLLNLFKLKFLRIRYKENIIKILFIRLRCSKGSFNRIRINCTPNYSELLVFTKYKKKINFFCYGASKWSLLENLTK